VTEFLRHYTSLRTIYCLTILRLEVEEGYFMAKVSLVLCCSHSTFLFTSPETWNETRAKRTLRRNVPHDSLESNVAKFDRCVKAFGVLREKIEAVRPDVLVIFGDDQGELFNFNNFPAMGIYLGEEFSGHRAVGATSQLPGRPIERRPKTPETWVSLRGHPELARVLLTGLMKRGFDLAFSLDLPNRDEGMGHAFMRPPHYLTPRYDIPIVPIFVNCYFSPQPTAKRCYDLGKAVREVIEESPLDLKVTVLGSGGLWHTPAAPDAYINEEFDRMILEAVKAGDARKMAEYFDDVRPPPFDSEAFRRKNGGTGMLGGIGSGTGETRNWIAAAAVADGAPGVVVDYVPVYASPCGMGFAYWDKL